MPVPLTPLKAFKCSYDDCFHSFDTETEMRAHLKSSGIHPYYCGKTPSAEKLSRGFVKCNFHGKTWEDLVAHKVETMLPWLVGERRHEKPKKLNHIVCEFCGIDLESLSGREAHRKNMHQAEQHVVCRGYINVRDAHGDLVSEECGSIFGRASQLITHIEGGYCPYLKPMTLRQEREHLRVIKLIMIDQETFKQKMRNRPGLPVSTPVEDEDETSGGVAIDFLSHDDFSQSNGPEPFSPQRSECSSICTESQAPVDLSENEWPSLPSSEVGRLNASMRSMSIASSDDRNMKKYARIDDNISLASEFGITESDSDSNAASETPTEPWSTASAARFLSRSIKSKASPNWNGISASHKRSKQEDENHLMFYTRFWDPYHEEFQPELFYSPEKDGPSYQCPLGNCQRRFPEAQQVGEHILEVHAAQRNICPVCGKEFERLSGLVSHFEASSSGAKCDVARRKGYDEFLEHITGGILEAKKTEKEPIYGYKLCKDGKQEDDGFANGQWDFAGAGVKDYDYTTKAPTRPGLTKW